MSTSDERTYVQRTILKIAGLPFRVAICPKLTRSQFFVTEKNDEICLYLPYFKDIMDKMTLKLSNLLQYCISFFVSDQKFGELSTM